MVTILVLAIQIAIIGCSFTLGAALARFCIKKVGEKLWK